MLTQKQNARPLKNAIFFLLEENPFIVRVSLAYLFMI